MAAQTGQPPPLYIFGLIPDPYIESVEMGPTSWALAKIRYAH